MHIYFVKELHKKNKNLQESIEKDEIEKKEIEDEIKLIDDEIIDLESERGSFWENFLDIASDLFESGKFLSSIKDKLKDSKARNKNLRILKSERQKLLRKLTAKSKKIALDDANIKKNTRDIFEHQSKLINLSKSEQGITLQIADIKSKIKEKESNKVESEKNLVVKRQKLTQINTKITQKEEQLRNKEKELDEIDGQIENKGNEIEKWSHMKEELTNKQETCKIEIETLNRNVAVLETESVAAQAEINIIRKEKYNKQQQLNQLPTTSHQNETHRHKNNLNS